MTESAKETFRKYLEQAGAIDVMVKGERLGRLHEASVVTRGHISRVLQACRENLPSRAAPLAGNDMLVLRSAGPALRGALEAQAGTRVS